MQLASYAALLQDGGPGITKVVLYVLLALAFLVFLFVFLRYANLYIRSILTRADVGLFDMVAMSCGASAPRRSSTRA